MKLQQEKGRMKWRGIKKQAENFDFCLLFQIGATGFEPATSASRTPRSTKLSHAPLNIKWLFPNHYLI